MKRDPKFFRVNKHAKICSSHFTEDDFIEPLASKKRLKRTAVPSKFIWTEPGRESTERQVLGKLQNPPLESHQAFRGKTEGNMAGAEAMAKDSEEVTHETLMDLSENLSKEWRDVGRKLKLKETDLRNIEADNKSNGQKEVAYQMLLLWKRKRGMAATNKTLIDALRVAGLLELHDNFLNFGKFGTTSGKGKTTVHEISKEDYVFLGLYLHYKDVNSIAKYNMK